MCHASRMVSPPLHSRMKYLNIYWRRCHEALHIYGPQMVNLNDSVDPLTFPLAHHKVTIYVSE